MLTQTEVQVKASTQALNYQPNPGDGPAGGVVVGGDYLGLGIARSLGRNRVPVCIIDDEDSMAPFSRYATKAVKVPDLRDERKAVAAVLEIGKKFNLRGWVLYPTRDELVAAFSRYREELTPFFRVPVPEMETVQWAWDKRNTYRLADELGIPTPRTWYPRNLRDLDGIHGEPPFAVKPAIKEHFFYDMGAKAWRANSREELRQLYQRAAAQVETGEVMIQNFIPGDGAQQYAYCAFFKEGRAVAKMVVRRRRQHPREFGKASTYVETIDLPVLEELSERFLRRINYYGLVELEYKVDPRDGQYKLLDVNGRAWGYHSLGVAAGVDFPHLMFSDQMGETVPPRRGRVGVRWIRLITDLPTAAMGMVKGQQPVWPYLKSLWGINTESVLCWDDPLPGLLEFGLMPYSHLKRALAKRSASAVPSAAPIPEKG